MLLTKIDHFFKKENMGQPVLSLIQFFFKWCREKNTAFDENREKNRAFRGNLYKILERTI